METDSELVNMLEHHTCTLNFIGMQPFHSELLWGSRTYHTPGLVSLCKASAGSSYGIWADDALASRASLELSKVVLLLATSL